VQETGGIKNKKNMPGPEFTGLVYLKNKWKKNSL